MFLLVEILLAGTVAVWLIGLLPALVVTAVKGNSRLLGWGFLTLGLAWFAGALALAPADSLWAQRHYDSEQLTRSRAALGTQRSPRVWSLWLLGFAVAVVLSGAFIARPAPILGVNGAALLHSMPHTGFDPQPCTRFSGGYRCGIESREASGSKITYAVELHERGCWTARPIEPMRREDWGRLSGCVSLWDYL